MAFLRGPIEPDEVVGREFSRVRRGYDPAEVREVLASLAAEIRRLTQTIGDLESTVSDLERRAVDPASLEPEVIASLLGEETVRVMNAAREAAAEIRSKAEENAARVVRDAYDSANRIRTGRSRRGAANRRGRTPPRCWRPLDRGGSAGRRCDDPGRARALACRVQRRRARGEADRGPRRAWNR